MDSFFDQTNEFKESRMTQDIASITERTFPEFVPTGRDLEALAGHYLNTYFEITTFEFCCGTYSTCQFLYGKHCFERFEEICKLLGSDIRREVIDDVERKCRQTTAKGAWEAFKTTVKEGFFSTPPDHVAIVQAARELDGWWDDAANFYSREYVAVLREALEREDARVSLTPNDVADCVTPLQDDKTSPTSKLTGSKSTT